MTNSRSGKTLGRLTATKSIAYTCPLFRPDWRLSAAFDNGQAISVGVIVPPEAGRPGEGGIAVALGSPRSKVQVASRIAPNPQRRGERCLARAALAAPIPNIGRRDLARSCGAASPVPDKSRPPDRCGG